MDPKLSLKTEKRFLAYLFNNKKYIALSLGKIRPEHLKSTWQIYDLLVGYYNKRKDIITDEIIDIMFQKRNISNDLIVNYKSIINELRAIPIGNDGEFEALIDELNDYRKREEYRKIADYIYSVNPAECPTKDLEKMENGIKQKMTDLTASESDVRKEGTIKNNAKNMLEQYEKIKNNPESLHFIKTGFKHIDDSEGGFLPGELVYVMGRKGDGKSVLLINLAHNTWLQGENVLLFTLEISKEDYERRFNARACEISSNGLKRGTLTEEEYNKFKKHIFNIEENKNVDGKKTGQLYIVDCPSGCTPAFIDAKIETLEQTLGIKFRVIITDYAGIMKPNIPVEVKRFEQGQIALDLKRIARSRECVVISAVQMNRKGKTDAKDGKTDTEHVAESDQISDHLDWGITIRSISEKMGVIESFKVRDASPFEFHFNKKYQYMKVEELQDDVDNWDSLGGLE